MQSGLNRNFCGTIAHKIAPKGGYGLDVCSPPPTIHHQLSTIHHQLAPNLRRSPHHLHGFHGGRALTTAGFDGDCKCRCAPGLLHLHQAFN